MMILTAVYKLNIVLLKNNVLLVPVYLPALQMIRYNQKVLPNDHGHKTQENKKYWISIFRYFLNFIVSLTLPLRNKLKLIFVVKFNCSEANIGGKQNMQERSLIRFCSSLFNYCRWIVH